MWNVLLFVVVVLCNSKHLFRLNTVVQCIYYRDVTFYCPCPVVCCFCLMIHFSNQKLRTASCVHDLVNMVTALTDELELSAVSLKQCNIVLRIHVFALHCIWMRPPEFITLKYCSLLVTKLSILCFSEVY